MKQNRNPIRSTPPRVTPTVSQNKPKCWFKPGDLVTGTDRTYQRSIYQLIKDFNGVEGEYRIVSLSGRVFPQKEEEERYARSHDEFRRATWMEIKISSTLSHKNLAYLLYKLGIISANP